MSLGTKHKRGAAVMISLPFRQWKAEPDGTLASTDRVALLYYSAAIAPAGAVAPNPVFVAAAIRSPHAIGTVRG